MSKTYNGSIHAPCGTTLKYQSTRSCVYCRINLSPKERQRRMRVYGQARLAALSHYGVSGKPICVCCAEPRLAFLQLDHINNDGAKHRSTLTTSIWRWLEKNNYPIGFQTLCANCNFGKKTNGTCPHLFDA